MHKNWLIKISRSQYGFLGEPFQAYRAVDLSRSLEVLEKGFPKDQFFATDVNRAAFYGHFSGKKHPGAIFNCLLDSSRSSVDGNDYDAIEGTTSHESIHEAAYEICSTLGISYVSEVENFIGSQVGSEIGYYNSSPSASLWLYLHQLTGLPINEIKNAISTGYYGDFLVLDNRGIFGIAEEVPEMQLQYSAEVPVENIKEVYLHSSILDSFKYPYQRYPSGAVVGLSDSISVIPAQVRDFANQIEDQLELAIESDDEDLQYELQSLLTNLQSKMRNYEMSDSAVMDGMVYRKLRDKKQLKYTDFSSPSTGYVAFSMPQDKMKLSLIIRKCLSRPNDPEQMYFPGII